MKTATNRNLEAAWIMMDIITTLLGVCTISFIRWQFLDSSLSGMATKVIISLVAIINIIPALCIDRAWQIVNSVIALYRPAYELYDVVDILRNTDIIAHIEAKNIIRLTVELVVAMSIVGGILWILLSMEWSYRLAFRLLAIFYLIILLICAAMALIINKDMRH